MGKRTRKLTSEEFQRQFAELLQSGSEREDIEQHSHLVSCAACRQLLRDYEIIAEAARSLFPDECGI
jgi:hypothetical protein